MYEVTEKILREVRKVIVGKDDVVEKVWISILAQGHVLLEDVPGVGKTTMALAFSKALGLETKRVQFTPDTMPSDIIGFSLPEQGRMVYQPGAVMTNLLLADEINRTSSKTQSALLEAMEEHKVTVDGKTYALPDPFIVLATQNPVGSAGTTMLPNSQLDRFLIRQDVPQLAVKGKTEFQERGQLGSVEVLGSLLIILEHPHIEPGGAGQLGLGEPGGQAGVLQFAVFLGVHRAHLRCDYNIHLLV